MFRQIRCRTRPGSRRPAKAPGKSQRRGAQRTGIDEQKPMCRNHTGRMNETRPECLLQAAENQTAPTASHPDPCRDRSDRTTKMTGDDATQAHRRTCPWAPHRSIDAHLDGVLSDTLTKTPPAACAAGGVGKRNRSISDPRSRSVPRRRRRRAVRSTRRGRSCAPRRSSLRRRRLR